MSNEETPPKHRRLPTISFSLPVDQMEQLRAIGASRDASLSKIVREAFDVALQHWGHSPVEREPEAQSSVSQPSHRQGRGKTEKAGVREIYRWPRALRRHAAQHGE